MRVDLRAHVGANGGFSDKNESKQLHCSTGSRSYAVVFLDSVANPIKDSKENVQMVIGIEWRWLNGIFRSRWWMEMLFRCIWFWVAIPSALPRPVCGYLEVMD